MTPLERAVRALWIAENARYVENAGRVWDAPEKEEHALYWTQKMEENRPVYIAKAAVVLLTLREPSEGMANSGDACVDRRYAEDGSYTSAIDAWQAMIDAALAEGPAA
jgi:hypothetical protein